MIPSNSKKEVCVDSSQIKGSMNNRKKNMETGFIGECYAMYKLALMGIVSANVGFMDYDILAANEARVEVKTAKLRTVRDKRVNTTRDVWNFTNTSRSFHYESNRVYFRGAVKRDRKCDFFVLVCF